MFIFKLFLIYIIYKSTQILSVLADRHILCNQHPNKILTIFIIPKYLSCALQVKFYYVSNHIPIFIISLNLSPLFLREGSCLRVLSVIIAERQVEIIKSKEKMVSAKTWEKKEKKRKKFPSLQKKLDKYQMTFLWSPSEWFHRTVPPKFGERQILAGIHST